MTLYEINQQIQDFIVNNLDLETGEVLNIENLAELEMLRQDKIEGVALYYKNCLADAEAIKNEIANLTARKKVLENTADRLKNYLKDTLQGEKFSTPKVAISHRKSVAVNVVDITQLNDEFLKYKDPEADKTAIKKAIQSGTVINGAELIENTNISIK